MAIEEIRNDVALSGELANGGQPSKEHLQELAQAGFECMINRVHSLPFSRVILSNFDKSLEHQWAAWQRPKT
jgi:hypothetical protein